MKKGTPNPTLFRKKKTCQTEDELFLQTIPSSETEPLDKAIATFTSQDPWRILRIQSEYVQAFDAMAEVARAICIFGSARVDENDEDYKKATEYAHLMAKAGYAVITGGGPGIMEAANKGALEADGVSIGCNIELPHEQHINPYVNLPVNFRYFFCRKTTFMKYSQGFVLFPGGYGTVDELFEAVTLIQTGKIKHFPIILMNTNYWGGLIDWIKNRLLAEEKISKEDLDLLQVFDCPKEASSFMIEKMKQVK